MKLQTYLNFPGNAEEAFNFYRLVFGGEFSSLVRFRDMPMAGMDVSREAEDKIMHISLPIGEKDILMASDTLEPFDQDLTVGNNVNIYIDAENAAEADRIFNALASGGTVEMPLANVPWGAYYGSLADRFGICWMVSSPTA